MSTLFFYAFSNRKRAEDLWKMYIFQTARPSLNLPFLFISIYYETKWFCLFHFEQHEYNSSLSPTKYWYIYIYSVFFAFASPRCAPPLLPLTKMCVRLFVWESFTFLHTNSLTSIFIVHKSFNFRGYYYFCCIFFIILLQKEEDLKKTMFRLTLCPMAGFPNHFTLLSGVNRWAPWEWPSPTRSDALLFY